MTEIDPVRSRMMRAVKSTNTKPELVVRKLAHALGYRFRLHRKDLPGSPDLAFIRGRKAIFVNGCFWHGHDCNRGARVPKSNTDYWRAKIARNTVRDARAVENLATRGWQSLTLWECELKHTTELAAKLRSFLR